ncbi:MAG: DUF167 family protein [Oligoflexia bacterium]|nr:DUF167 family protein [Oligoflexia bacterium]
MSATPPKWISQASNGVVLRLHIQPKASRSQICGEHGEGESIRLKVRIAAPPLDGAANEELLRFLKKCLGVPTSRLHLIRGETSRSKDVLVEGASTDAILAILKDI